MKELIKGIRSKLGLSQEGFAKALSTTPVTVSRWENGVVIPNKMAQDRIFGLLEEKGIDCLEEVVCKIRIENSGDSTLLYHGSKSGIDGPILPISRSFCDFGSGFYLGTDPIQPLTLISDEEKPVVYSTHLDMTGLKVLKLGLDLEWALLISYHRGYMDKHKESELYKKYCALTEGYDVVIGYIADDRMYRVMKAFFEGNITDEALINSLSALDLGMQYVCKTKKACDKVKVIKSRELSPLELSILKKVSYKRREEGVRTTDQIVMKYRRVGRYYDEIVGGEL